MLQIAANRAWRSRLVASTAVVFAFLFGLDRPVRADLIVSDLGGQLRRFDNNGVLLQTVSGGGEGIACAMIGGVGQLFVANNTATITIYNPANLAVIGSFTISGAGGLAGLSLSADGLRLYAPDHVRGKIWILDTTPVLKLSTLAPLITPAAHDVAVSPVDGSVYTAFFAFPTLGVQKFTPTFTRSILSGYTGPAFFIPLGPPGKLTFPGGLVVDHDNNLWVSNAFHASDAFVNKYDVSGAAGHDCPFHCFLFTVPVAPGDDPTGLALGPQPFNSDIYDVEVSSDTIGKITQTSVTSGARSLFINSPDAGVNPTYLQFTENCITATGCGPDPLQALVGTWTFSMEGTAGSTKLRFRGTL